MNDNDTENNLLDINKDCIVQLNQEKRQLQIELLTLKSFNEFTKIKSAIIGIVFCFIVNIFLVYFVFGNLGAGLLNYIIIFGMFFLGVCTALALMGILLCVRIFKNNEMRKKIINKIEKRISEIVKDIQERQVLKHSMFETANIPIYRKNEEIIPQT